MMITIYIKMKLKENGKVVGSYLYNSTDKIFITYDSKEAVMAKYEYAALRITTEDMLNSEMVRGFHDIGLVHCEHLMGIPKGWEYVNTLCQDGDKAAYVLVRRLKPEKKKSKINS